VGKLASILIAVILFPAAAFAQQGFEDCSLSIEISDTVRTAETSLASYLAGRVPGLTFRQSSGAPGDMVSLQIRNFGEPLYVIDGVVSTREDFNDLDISSVKKINVMGNGRASSYGYLGANGVIEAWTRDPGPSGPVSVSADVRYGVQQYTFVPDGMNDFQTEYARAMKLVNTGEVSDSYDLALLRLEMENYLEDKDNVPTFKPSQMMYASAKVAGGKPKFSYRAGLNFVGAERLNSCEMNNKVNLQAGIKSEMTDWMSLSYSCIGTVRTEQYKSLRNLLTLDFKLPVEGMTLNSGASYNIAAPMGAEEFLKNSVADAHAFLAYNREFGKWRVGAEGGCQYFSQSTGESKLSLMGLLASAGASYKGAYTLEASVRSDLSSSFKPLVLPFARFAWSLAHEDFYRNSSAAERMNEFELSASYGKTALSGGIAQGSLRMDFLKSRLILNTDVFARTGESLTPGFDFNMKYMGKKRKSFSWSIGANLTFARNMETSVMESGQFGYGRYWNSRGLFKPDVWMYQTVGVFQSKSEISTYTVNIDGQNNTTLLPGDYIIKDWNGDGVINEYDMRPLGWSGSPNPDGTTNPCLSAGLTFSMSWGSFDLEILVRGGFLNSWSPEWLTEEVPTYASTTLDVWHRENVYDPASAWVRGTFPAYRGAADQSSPQVNNDSYKINVNYLRLGDFSAGYTLRFKNCSLRPYVAGTNLFVLDNVSRRFRVDPESKAYSLEGRLPYKTICLGLAFKFR